MKRRTAALTMGLMIALSQVAAAAETGTETETETESTAVTQEMQPPAGENGQPPEMPAGENGERPEMPGGGNGERPEMPGGGNGENGQPPEMPGGENGGMGGPGGNMGMPGGAAGGVESYEAVSTYDEESEDTEISGETIESTGTDENAVLVDGAEVTVKDTAISRVSEDSTGGDQSSFYGVGAAALAVDGTLYISGSTIDTDSAGGAGAFAYGTGTVYIADTTISTEQNTSGGIHAAGGGTLYAWNLDVTTNGGSAAAIRSDRGGGTMVVDGGSYTSNGSGSPAIYCTADISVKDAELEATGSEAICIEGLNTIRLYDCDLTGNMPDQEQNDTTWNVIVYQSMSGDSQVGNGTFQMTGGTLTAENGGMFYTTNTESTFLLSGVEIIPAEENLYFLKVTGNSNQRGWGQTGSNGANCTFTAQDQEMEGDVIWDSISTLDFYMTEGSRLTGAFVNDESCAGEGGDGWANLVIDQSSEWIVTGDSVLTSLCCAGSITDSEGRTVTIEGTDGTVYVEGTSDYTVTVETYSDTAVVSGAGAFAAWEDYAVEKPAQLA